MSEEYCSKHDLYYTTEEFFCPKCCDESKDDYKINIESISATSDKNK